MENDVAKEVEAMLEKAQPLFTTESCCIYKVPHPIRQSSEDAYTPVLVSIGPLHHGNSRLVTMEGHKQFYCQHFIQRSEASLSDLVSCVKQLEPQIRACYSEKIELTVDELVKVIFIDCCFVIDLFLRDYERTTEDDVIFSKDWVWNRVSDDLILLENQVPLFVVEKIYNLAFASHLHGGGFPSFMWIPFIYANSIEHFTDLLRYFNLPPSHTTTPLLREPKALVLGHSASELVEAGVKFQVTNKPSHRHQKNKSSHGHQKDESSHGCMLDLKFERGTLNIPHIEADDATEIFLRNIVALEQCHYPKEHYILDYVIFLGHLMKTNKDAGVLIKAGIIGCIFGGDYESKVANLFGGVGKNTVVSTTSACYLKFCNDLDDYCIHPWHSLMATLRRDYFTSPWKTAASFGGIVLLILTVIQTVCSLRQV
ncbi:UPF0481 protein At3g47200 [Arachis hypogaea]|uniref:UPF0481 protein At3g47200 n=1 Tax=Arachis hypogaea TaxID=3818 RepID=UPI0011057295|nr:UPF0481 protein At3g47200 [Arachis hypogaea]